MDIIGVIIDMFALFFQPLIIAIDVEMKLQSWKSMNIYAILCIFFIYIILFSLQFDPAPNQNESDVSNKRTPDYFL